jgi:hypothetical protein
MTRCLCVEGDVCSGNAAAGMPLAVDGGGW